MGIRGKVSGVQDREIGEKLGSVGVLLEMWRVFADGAEAYLRTLEAFSDGIISNIKRSDPSFRFDLANNTYCFHFTMRTHEVAEIRCLVSRREDLKPTQEDTDTSLSSVASLVVNGTGGVYRAIVIEGQQEDFGSNNESATRRMNTIFAGILNENLLTGKIALPD